MWSFNPGNAVFVVLAAQLAAAQGNSSMSTSSGAGSPTQSASSVTSAASSITTTGASTGTAMSSSAAAVSTAVPAPTAPLSSPVETLPLPPVQPWCNGGNNATYCPGSLMQVVQLSGIYNDSKTFPDKPTQFNESVTYQAFNALPVNVTVGDVETFVEKYFKGEGLELETVQIENFTQNPAFLDVIEDELYKGFVSTVNGYWSLLVRQTNESALCINGSCESSLIPLNRSFIVPGGRYREIYYWDSFWILEGLLKSELYLYAYNLLENFMDLIEKFGFLPNGGRSYYLNRSQPPVFVQMLNSYIQVTGNVSILVRALPIAETELQWWRTNRTITVTSPYTGNNHSVARYFVTNSAPRPEGYVEDITTAFGATPPLNESARSALYAELASGAETGWDYSSRWCKQPLLNLTDNDPALRTLNVRQQIPVDLNSLLYGDHVLLANLYEIYMNSTMGSSNSSSNSSIGMGAWYNNSTPTSNMTSNSTSSSNMTGMVQSHRMIAKEFESAINDLMWDKQKLWWYDFNVTANARADIYHPGGLFPLWQNITPSEIQGNDTAALGVFAGVRYMAGMYPGPPAPATLIETGLNWDAPNVWPPHVYTGIKALETILRINPNSSVVSNITLSDFSQIPTGQLGLNQSQLPAQPASVLGNNSMELEQSIAQMQKGLPWPTALAIEFANRYLQSAFCSWYSTGGSIPGLLQQLSAQELNITGSLTSGSQAMGNIFEKFNLTNVDAAGGGGEYTVQIGFGWSNGVLLHTAGEYGQYLVQPSCPLIIVHEAANATMANATMTNVTMTNNTKVYSGYRLPQN